MIGWRKRSHPHSYTISAGGNVSVVQISLDGFRSVFSSEYRDFLGLERLDWVERVPPVHPSYERLTPPILQLFQDDLRPTDQIAPICSILEILSAVDRVAPGDLKTNDPMRRIIEFTENHWHESVTLAQVAGYAFLSVPHLCRVFKTASGTSYIDYLSRLRVEKACGLLRGGLSVTEACHESGFQNLSHFIHVFKRYLGQTPGKFRQATIAN